jgi:hypothetical protein
MDRTPLRNLQQPGPLLVCQLTGQLEPYARRKGWPLQDIISRLLAIDAPAVPGHVRDAGAVKGLRTIRTYLRSPGTMRRCGRRCSIAFRRWSVPRHDQHCPRRPPEDTFADGTLSKPLPSAPPVGAEDDEIRLPRIGMQHDRAGWIAVLLDDPHRNALALGPLPEPGQKLETFPLMPGERMTRRYGVQDVEPALACASDAQRSIEGVLTGLREIDRAHDPLERLHMHSLSSMPLVPALRT